MTLTLNNIKTALNSHKFFLLAGFAVIILLTVIIVQQLTRTSKPVYTPPPASRQPVVQGKLDTSAPIVQQSRTSLEKLKPNLPYRETITTTSGSVITITAYSKTPDEYDLYVGIPEIDFTVPENDPNFEKNVRDFNEAATQVFAFLNQNNVQPSAIYIVWADSFQTQKTAESWLGSNTTSQDKTQ